MLEIVPMTLKEANAFVEQNHRHHGKVTGHKFSIGLSDGEKIVGVAIVGRPVARHLDDGWTLEVNRLCTDGSRNACSMLYAASWRAARAMGYKRVVNVLTAADDVLIPIRPDEFSFSGLLDLVEQVDGVREAVNPGLTMRGAFFTHWQNRETFAQARRSLEDSGICPVLQTAISYNPKVPESTLEETPLCVLAPRSWAAIQYKKLTAEYLSLTDSDKGKEG